MLHRNRKMICRVVLGLGLLGVVQTGFAEDNSRTLSNLERERSAMIALFVDEALTPIEREQHIALSQRRLMDLERMVIRDDRLLGSKNPRVQQAFERYDATFLVHASAEAEQPIVDFWLKQLQLDSEQVLTSKKGRR